LGVVTLGLAAVCFTACAFVACGFFSLGFASSAFATLGFVTLGFTAAFFAFGGGACWVDRAFFAAGAGLLSSSLVFRFLDVFAGGAWTVSLAFGVVFFTPAEPRALAMLCIS